MECLHNTQRTIISHGLQMSDRGKTEMEKQRRKNREGLIDNVWISAFVAVYQQRKKEAKN